ncbi:MAG: hypothetical protein HZC42_15575 [Candidatus Eisenbacteria bacterium]|nr:hypothetical protein [Candidatus Eisenbacteria bacterium]
MRADRTGWIAFLVALALALVTADCARRGGPPPIARGTPCAACGMKADDLAFACERQVGRGWRVYDAIECLIGDVVGTEGDAVATPAGAVFLADYDTETLHDADSLWVVKGSFPTPMGGGYAAFLARAAAESIAAQTAGRVDRLAAFVAVKTARAE